MELQRHISDRIIISIVMLCKLIRKRGWMPMIELMEFISKHWHLLGLLCGIFGFMFHQIHAMRKGVRALLRADLIRLYNKYHDDLGYCPLYVKQSLEDEYKQYHTLKGNGVGTEMYEGLMALPTQPLHKKKEE